MHLPSWQLRMPHTFLLIALLCAILWTAYFVGTDRHGFSLTRLKLPHSVEGGGHHWNAEGEELIEKEPPALLNHTYASVEVAVPPGVNIIALVFFGRRELVKILDCYLKRNLKDKGGLLDQVIFAVNTKDKDDLAYLEELVLSHPLYSKHVAKKDYEWWIGSWEAVDEPDSIYLKIDDDVVFMEDSTIPSLVKRMIENPEYFAVSANVVNNPALSWVHYNMGVYKPYWPELKPHGSPSPPSWRASDLPSYNGPPEGPKDFKIDGSTPAPYKGHRWLPVRPKDGHHYDITRTAASTMTYSDIGPSLENWAVAAQTHYSFLQHLEQGDTWRYKFNTWDYAYRRLSINFFAVRGRDILDVFPFPQQDDEAYLTMVRPKELRRHVIVDGTGLAVHFAFRPQYNAHSGKGVGWTDLLGRYAAYATEMSCPSSLNVTSKAPLQ